MGSWGDDYDGFVKANDKTKPALIDRHGRVMPVKAAQDKPMRQFRDNINVERLTEFLDGDEKYDKFVKALASPSYAHWNFATLCRKHGITLHELQALYTDGMRQKGLISISTALPLIMQDVGEDAQSSMVVCPRCDGLQVLVTKELNDQGEVVATTRRECPVCDGIGKIKQVGDKHARDLVFETMKLTGQKGPMVAIQQNFGGSDGLNASMETMLKLTQTITMPTQTDAPKQIEASVKVVDEE